MITLPGDTLSFIIVSLFVLLIIIIFLSLQLRATKKEINTLSISKKSLNPYNPSQKVNTEGGNKEDIEWKYCLQATYISENSFSVITDHPRSHYNIGRQIRLEDNFVVPGGTRVSAFATAFVTGASFPLVRSSSGVTIITLSANIVTPDTIKVWSSSRILDVDTAHQEPLSPFEDAQRVSEKDCEWICSSPSRFVTYINNKSFFLEGDFTDLFYVGRAVRLTLTAIGPDGGARNGGANKHVFGFVSVSALERVPNTLPTHFRTKVTLTTGIVTSQLTEACVAVNK